MTIARFSWSITIFSLDEYYQDMPVKSGGNSQEGVIFFSKLDPFLQIFPVFRFFPSKILISIHIFYTICYFAFLSQI